jgi:hypothetical protein
LVYTARKLLSWSLVRNAHLPAQAVQLFLTLCQCCCTRCSAHQRTGRRFYEGLASQLAIQRFRYRLSPRFYRTWMLQSRQCPDFLAFSRELTKVEYSAGVSRYRDHQACNPVMAAGFRLRPAVLLWVPRGEKGVEAAAHALVTAHDCGRRNPPALFVFAWWQG